MLTEAQAAERLGMGVATLRNWRCAKKNLAFHKLGRVVRYDSEEVERFLRSNLHVPSSVLAAKEMRRGNV